MVTYLTPEEKKEYNRQWRLDNPGYRKDYRKQNLERINKRDKEYKENNPEKVLDSKRRSRVKTRRNYAESGRRMFNAAKGRAKDCHLDFDLEHSDIIVPEICPILKIPLVFNQGKVRVDSPSLGRKIPDLGYIKGNVEVFSHKANRMKGDMTKEIWLNLGRYMGWINE